MPVPAEVLTRRGNANASRSAAAAGVSTLSNGSAPRLTVGLSGASRNAAVAACENGTLVAFCEQERVTRVRGVRLEPGAVPVEALAAVLDLAGGRAASDVQKYVLAEPALSAVAGVPSVHVEHHLAHAASAFHTSPFQQAAVLVCDHHSATELSVWVGDGSTIKRHARQGGRGVAALYSACTELFGLSPGEEHQIEALARLNPGVETDRFDRSIGYADGDVWVSPDWKAVVADWLEDDEVDPVRRRSLVASAFQRHLGRVLLELVADIRASTGMPNLCLGGGLFYNTYFNTVIRRAGIFDDVFVAPNPGNAGAAAGAALVESRLGYDGAPVTVSPFLGPEYDLEEIKRTLDNCKLSYECLGEGEMIAATVDALQRGQMVGWFQGRMEWGHRALGNRSILASPLSPYVLDNLNVFLKHRERYRTYGLSVTEADAQSLFVGPPVSRFMEYDYEIRDRERFKHVLANEATTLRVQTVPDSEESRRFRLVHKAFGEATGVPVLVNTSFNGFSEPIVCSPRDAVRVFFGTGLDMLVLDRFIIRK